MLTRAALPIVRVSRAAPWSHQVGRRQSKVSTGLWMQRSLSVVNASLSLIEPERLLTTKLYTRQLRR